MKGELVSLLVGMAFVATAACVWTAAMLVRNARVAAYRRRVLDVIVERNDAALDVARARIGEPDFWPSLAQAKREMQARWDAYHEVTYDEMLNKFWRPLDSFMPPELRPVKETAHG